MWILTLIRHFNLIKQQELKIYKSDLKYLIQQQLN